MTEIALKIGIALAAKLLTETFLARLLIHLLRAWSETTTNKLDDKVVQAMADALGVPAEKLKADV
jgi:hypothetical protein